LTTKITTTILRADIDELDELKQNEFSQNTNQKNDQPINITQ